MTGTLLMRHALEELAGEAQDAVEGMGYVPTDLWLSCSIRGRVATVDLVCGRELMCRAKVSLAAPVSPGLDSPARNYVLRRCHRALADRGLYIGPASHDRSVSIPSA